MKKYPEGAKWHATKYGLTMAEASELALHPRRDQIIDAHERWLASVGHPAHSSPLSRGMLLDMVRGREGFADNPLPGSPWLWAAGALATLVAGYLVFREKPAAAKPKATAQGIPLASFASPADYITKTSAAVGGYGSAHLKNKSITSRRTSSTPAAVRDVWEKQALEFAKRKYVLAVIRQGAPIPTSIPSSQLIYHFSAPEKGFSKQKFLIFRPEHGLNVKPNGVACSGVDMQIHPELKCESVWGWNPTDEWGNAYEGWGVSSDPLNTVLLITQTVLPYIPGVGSGAAAALAGVIALGQGKSLDEATLAAARAALPPGAQLAFDLGVGVVLEKKPVDQAVTDAALNQLDKQYPGSKAAYAQGKDLAKQHGLGRVIWS